MKNEKLAIPFITLSKSVNWLKSLGRRNDENLTLLERVSYVTTLTYTSVRNIYKVRKDIVKGLVDETSLSKKQAKKIADDSVLSVADAFDTDEDRVEAYDFFETNILMLYSIRSNKHYSEEVYRYCDNDLKTLNWMINDDDDDDGGEWLTIAHQKRLNALIDKYINSFDKFGTVSKKYNGIWY